MNKILILEDDRLFAETLCDFLGSDGFLIECARDGAEAMCLASKNRYALYLLDVKVPLIDGFDFLSSLREEGDFTPAIFVTSLSSKDALSKGFQSGCDDYLKKPFDLDELLLRVRAVLGRANALQERVVVGTKTTLLPESYTLIVDGRTHRLAPQECDLLKLLLQNKNRVVSKDEIYDTLWSGKENSGALRVYISKLKSILGENAIENIRGMGYLLR